MTIQRKSLTGLDATARKFAQLESELRGLAPSISESIKPIVPRFKTIQQRIPSFLLTGPPGWAAPTVKCPNISGYNKVIVSVSWSFKNTNALVGVEAGLFINDRLVTYGDGNMSGYWGDTGVNVGFYMSGCRCLDQFTVKALINQGEQNQVPATGFTADYIFIYFNDSRSI